MARSRKTADLYILPATRRLNRKEIVRRVFLSMPFLLHGDFGSKGRFWHKHKPGSCWAAWASAFPPFRGFGRTGSAPPVLFKAPFWLGVKLMLVLLVLACD
jgi:hypothetical protein